MFSAKDGTTFEQSLLDTHNEEWTRKPDALKFMHNRIYNTQLTDSMEIQLVYLIKEQTQLGISIIWRNF